MDIYNIITPALYIMTNLIKKRMKNKSEEKWRGHNSS